VVAITYNIYIHLPFIFLADRTNGRAIGIE